MMLVKSAAVAAAVAGLLVAEPARAQTKQEQGAVAGAIFGGILGAVIPGGRGIGGQAARILAPVAGAIIGASIGAAMDEADRKSMQAATTRALNSGKAQSFKSNKGTSGRVIPTAMSKNSEGQTCRTVTQEFTKADGTVLKEPVSACKNASGGWTV